MVKAIQYIYTLRPRLACYVNDDSAVCAPIMYSLISTCRTADVEPIEWMTDVLRKLPIYKELKKDVREPYTNIMEKEQTRQLIIK